MQTPYTSFKKQLDYAGAGLSDFNTGELASSYSNMLNAIPGITVVSSAGQITSFSSLVLKAETNKGNIWTELFFEDVAGWGHETVVNIFRNKEHQFNSSGTFADMMQSLEEYFGSESVPA